MANKPMKSCLESLVFKERQVKTAMKYYFTPIKLAKIKKTNNNKQW